MKPKLLALLLLFFAALSALAEERWYTFYVADTPVGYVSEATDGPRTETVVFLRLLRLGKAVEMRFATTAVESAGGDLEKLTYDALLSKQSTRLEAHVEGDGIRIVTGPHDRTVARGDERILGPAAVARMTAERLRQSGDAIEYTIFSPELQRVARVRRAVIGVDPGSITLEETLEGMPMKRTLTVDPRGVMIGDSMPGPFGTMRSQRSTREAALAANGTLPADLYEKTVARSNVRLADAAAVDRIVVRIRARDDGPALPEFTTHNQRVIDRRDGVTLEIRRTGDPAPSPGEEFLAPNALVESDNAEIVKLAKEIAGKKTNGFAKAQALTQWVAENLSMDAGIVMAPASELVRDRKGTCMGYATLLASLARAAGVPSRIALGYVYYGGIWGGHAWTELWVDGRWLPFDAAVYAPGIAGATRIAAGASSFRDGGGDLNAALAPLFGRVDVEVMEIEQNGRTTRITEGKPFRVQGSTYTNAGLGLRVAANGYAIERADSTWPSTLVVAFRRGDTKIELHQQPRYPARPVEMGDGETILATPEGATLWLWKSAGPKAAEELRRFLANVEKSQPL
jgi:hypothetical protein